MSSMTHCPHCSKELGVPLDTLETAEVECPLCKLPFGLHETYPGNLPKVVVLRGLTPAEGEGDRNSEGALPAETGPVITLNNSLNLEGTSGFEVPLRNNADAATFSDPQTNNLFAPSLTATSTNNLKKRRRVSPFIHLFGIVFFGVVGLGLGLGVLCFFGKATPIIQLLPENSFKEWLHDFNRRHIGDGQ